MFGFQIGVSKHEVEADEPMILNVLPACNMSLFAKQGLVSRYVRKIITCRNWGRHLKASVICINEISKGRLTTAREICGKKTFKAKPFVLL